MIIKKVFDTINNPAWYRLKIVYCPISTNFTNMVIAARSGSTNHVYSTKAVTQYVWDSFVSEVFVSQSYRDLYIVCGQTPPFGADRFIHYKYIQVEKIIPAEVQDSDVQSAGRRLSYYEGSKMTSQDYNVDSPDTVDGGPVIVVNTVTANTPSSNPIGSSIGPVLNNPNANVSSLDNTAPQA